MSRTPVAIGTLRCTCIMYWWITLFRRWIHGCLKTKSGTKINGFYQRSFAGIQHANINIIYDAYKPDLTKTRQEFGDEVRWWDERWQLQVTKPSTLVANVDKTSEVAYPCVYNILHILLTMPVTCERSFSSMRRIKSYLRSTMTDERLSTLGVLHIHRHMDVNIDRVINMFASVKCRNLDFILFICFFLYNCGTRMPNWHKLRPSVTTAFVGAGFPNSSSSWAIFKQSFQHNMRRIRL